MSSWMGVTNQMPLISGDIKNFGLPTCSNSTSRWIHHAKFYKYSLSMFARFLRFIFSQRRSKMQPLITIVGATGTGKSNVLQLLAPRNPIIPYLMTTDSSQWT